MPRPTARPRRSCLEPRPRFGERRRMLKFGVRAKLRGLGLYPQIPAQQGLVPFLSRLAWMLWSIGCNRGAIARTGVAPSPLAPQWAARFQSEIDNAPLTTIAAEDHAPGY